MSWGGGGGCGGRGVAGGREGRERGAWLPPSTVGPE